MSPPLEGGWPAVCVRDGGGGEGKREGEGRGGEREREGTKMEHRERTEK